MSSRTGHRYVWIGISCYWFHCAVWVRNCELLSGGNLDFWIYLSLATQVCFVINLALATKGQVDLAIARSTLILMHTSLCPVLLFMDYLSQHLVIYKYR